MSCRARCLALLPTALAAVLGVACQASAGAPPQASPPPAPTDWAALVNPFVGTLGHGHTHPAATLPFGMVQVGPDTRRSGWDGCSGYHGSDRVMLGFSHTHLSGTGVSDYGDILLMPTTGPVVTEQGTAEDPDSGFASRFDKATESASPGAYAVHLADHDVEVELTATERVGFHRYRYPGTRAPHLVLDLEHRDEVTDSYLEVVSPTEVRGYRMSRAWALDQRVYFAAEFSSPTTGWGLAEDGVLSPGRASARGTRLVASFDWPEDQGELMVKVALSGVSMEGAARNLQAELPGWDFEGARAAAREAWNERLGRIEIEGGSRSERRTFYTALYHSLLAPNLFNDVDGQYRGLDGEQHRADHEVYTVFSLWDTFRAAHPLFTLIEVERTEQFLQTFLRQFEQGGALPIWELAGNYTGCMIGYHALAVIADAHAKGLGEASAEALLEAMLVSAEADTLGLDTYKRQGFIPSNHQSESVSRTLEYAYDDWCIASMAERLGHADLAQRYSLRAQSYRHVFDPSTGFMRAKLNQAFATPFDPTQVDFNFTEANSWQYSFFAPHDIDGLVRLHGGDEALIAKLDAMFGAPPETTGRQQADITGLIGQYAHGNEPSHHMAWLYNYLGQPWKAQARVRQILDELYSDAPDGLCGNEDCGQMSAWYVLSALGLYPVCPGRPEYALGAPLFPRAVVHLEDGTSFEITAPGAERGHAFVERVTLDGEPWTASFLRHADLVAGARVEVQLAATPNQDWAREVVDRPRSGIRGPQLLPVPYVQRGARTFVESLIVELRAVVPEATIRFTLDGSTPTAQSPAYERPLELLETTRLRAFAELEGWVSSPVVEAKFRRIEGGRSVVLEHPPDPQYHGGGADGLIDTLRGTTQFATGAWQGHEGRSLVATVDLGQARDLRHLSAGFLQDSRSWILLPREVVFEVSGDGEHWREVLRTRGDLDPLAEQASIAELGGDLPPAAADAVRWVRLRAEPFGPLPEGHLGAGSPAWIFIDEFVIE